MEQEKRKYIRHHLEYSVTIIASHCTMSGQTRNLSGDGAFICCKQPLNPQESVGLSIKFPDGFLMEVLSQVVWSRHTEPDDEERPSGMGVRFLR